MRWRRGVCAGTKWGGTAVACVAALAVVASRWIGFVAGCQVPRPAARAREWSSPFIDRCVSLEPGALHFSQNGDPGWGPKDRHRYWGWWTRNDPGPDWPRLPRWGWNYQAQGTYLPVYDVYVPLWVPLLTGGLPATAIWTIGIARRRRQGAADHCTSCGYDRRGLAADAACPECGEPAASARG